MKNRLWFVFLLVFIPVSERWMLSNSVECTCHTKATECANLSRLFDDVWNLTFTMRIIMKMVFVPNPTFWFQHNTKL